MLPTNPQSLTAADRSVLESLKQQGEQIDRQSKVLETLVDRVTRQMRSDEKLEKSDQKQKNQFKGDTKVNAIPGMAFDKISDKFNDFIVSGFSSIKDKFKEEKSKPVDKSREPALKDKKPKEDTDVLKNILNNMVTTSKYQEQMLEHTKALQSIADKTYVSINELNNNLQTPENIEQPTENTVTTDNNTEKTKVEKKEKNTLKLLSNNEKSKLPASNDNIFGAANETTFTDKKLPDEIGVAVGKSLKPNLDNLGKTLKDALAQGFGNLELAVNDIDTASLPIPPVAGAVGGGAALLGSTALAAGVVTGGALLASGASNALSNATDEQLGMLSADIGSDTGIAAAAMLESRQPKLKPKEEQASIRKIDNQIANAESERNAADKKTGGRYTEGRLERRADKIKPEYLKFAQKFYNDPNLQDPDYLSLPENKGILELLEERQKLNMNPEIEKVKPKKGESTSLMKSVTDENRELTSKGSTQGAPIIVNNTTNAVSESGSSANFASATPRNQSTAVNDYLRGNGKLHDAVYR